MIVQFASRQAQSAREKQIIAYIKYRLEVEPIMQGSLVLTESHVLSCYYGHSELAHIRDGKAHKKFTNK